VRPGPPAGNRRLRDGSLLMLTDPQRLDILAGLWSGERFAYSGKHHTVDPVRFTPVPVQQPRIPVWVGGVLPASRPIARAARWDGMVPIRFGADGLIRPSAPEIGATSARIAALRGTADDFDMIVWAEVAKAPGDVKELAPPYLQAGATWWIETARPESGWWQDVQRRVAAGV
jgi:Luciferase-like monooxygenase